VAMLERIYEKISKALHYLACVWFIGLLLLVITSISARYFFRSPFSFTEELVGLLVATTLLLAIPFVSHEGKHIKVTMLSDLFRGWLKIGAGLFCCLVTLVFTVWFGYASLEWVEFAYNLNLKTTSTGIPLTPWMVTLPLIMFLLALAALLDFLKIIMGIRNKKRQKTDFSKD